MHLDSNTPAQRAATKAVSPPEHLPQIFVILELEGAAGDGTLPLAFLARIIHGVRSDEKVSSIAANRFYLG